MLGFFRKPKPKVEPRVVEIKPEHQMELRQVWDAYRDAKTGKTAAQYAFWRRAHDLYPELEDFDNSQIEWDGLSGHFEEVL